MDVKQESIIVVVVVVKKSWKLEHNTNFSGFDFLRSDTVTVTALLLAMTP